MRRVLAALLFVPALGHATGLLTDHPRYAKYQAARQEWPRSVHTGEIVPTWAPDSASFTYSREGKTYRFDVKTRTSMETTAPPPSSLRRPRRGPGRGRQNSTVTSPDGKRVATSRDRNVYVSMGGTEKAITTDANDANRTKYGVASWVYGEELGVQDAMWWSPDGRRLVYYRFDESGVKDYYLATDQRQFQDKLYPEAYPKAGAPNPKVALRVWDAETGKTTTLQADFGDASLAEYLYDVRWTPGGTSILFNRTNRKQNVMQLVAANPETGVCRVVVEERQPQSWAENHPTVRFLKDGRRFVWSTEKNGYVNYELRDLDGRLLNPLTTNEFDALALVDVDEAGKRLFYRAAGPDNPYHEQLHVVNLDGRGDRRLTDPSYDHRVFLSPDRRSFVDNEDRWDVPATSRLRDLSGKEIAVVALPDRTRFDALGLRPREVFTYVAADGKTKLYGRLELPSDFDPKKKYPVVLDVYGGPESGGIGGGFQIPSPTVELGFIRVNLAGRGTTGRGKAFRDAVYGKLGVIEMADQAAGIRALAQRPYIDGARVGVYGTSYGGYSTVMLMLRHPDVFSAGVASSAVTDFRNYDTIYTERYFGLPWKGENEAGYDAGSGVKLASSLKGPLLLFFGSSDDNVHPANAYQLVDALDKADRRYEMQVGPDQGHAYVGDAKMLEFFWRTLRLGE